jgi:hypothetical protein
MSIINFNFKFKQSIEEEKFNTSQHEKNIYQHEKYITMNDMGNYCRLGNQMFQYSFLKYISTITKLPIHIRLLNTNNLFYKTRLLECFKLLGNIKILDESNFDIEKNNNKVYNIKETTLEFDEKLINEIKSIDLSKYNIININGYFQSEKYFLPIKDTILNDFKFNNYVENIANNIINKHKKEADILISLHIRRGDITTLKAANLPLTLSYIENSIKYMNNKLNGKFYPPREADKLLYIVLSDDIKYCKEILPLIENNIVFITHETQTIENEYIDLCIMSKCNHHILSGSSFSWWGAYLNQNKNKIVIVPDPWFNINHEDGKRLCSQDKDIIPKDWIKINN